MNVTLLRVHTAINSVVNSLEIDVIIMPFDGLKMVSHIRAVTLQLHGTTKMEINYNSLIEPAVHYIMNGDEYETCPCNG